MIKKMKDAGCTNVLGYNEFDMKNYPCKMIHPKLVKAE